MQSFWSSPSVTPCQCTACCVDMIHGDRLYALPACPNKRSQRQQISQQRSIGIRVVKAKGEAALTSEMPGQPRGARSRGQSSRGGGSEPGELHLLAIELDDRVARKERAKRSKNGSPRARPAPRGAGQEGASRRPPIVPARPPRASERPRGTEARCRVL